MIFCLTSGLQWHTILMFSIYFQLSFVNLCGGIFKLSSFWCPVQGRINSINKSYRVFYCPHLTFLLSKRMYCFNGRLGSKDSSLNLNIWTNTPAPINALNSSLIMSKLQFSKKLYVVIMSEPGYTIFVFCSLWLNFSNLA